MAFGSFGARETIPFSVLLASPACVVGSKDEVPILAKHKKTLCIHRPWEYDVFNTFMFATLMSRHSEHPSTL